MPEIIENQPEKVTCWKSTKTRACFIGKTIAAPVEYPVDEAKGQGWCDVCNATCGILCFAPKLFVLILATPHICCCAKLEDLKE